MLGRCCSSLQRQWQSYSETKKTKTERKSVSHCCTETAKKYRRGHMIMVLVFWNSSSPRCFWGIEVGVWKVKLFSCFVCLFGFLCKEKTFKTLGFGKSITDHGVWNYKSYREWEFLFCERDWAGSWFWQGTGRTMKGKGRKHSKKSERGRVKWSGISWKHAGGWQKNVIRELFSLSSQNN